MKSALDVEGRLACIASLLLLQIAPSNFLACTFRSPVGGYRTDGRTDERATKATPKRRSFSFVRW